MIRFNRAFGAILVLALVAVMTTACGSKGSGMGPDPTPGPTFGTITIVYQRPAGMTCQSPADSLHCTAQPTLQSVDASATSAVRWGSYAFSGLSMNDVGSGKFSVSVTAPAAKVPYKLGFYVHDSWLCDPNGMCNYDDVNTGVSVNGVAMNNHSGDRSAFWFSYDPATGIVTPQ